MTGDIRLKFDMRIWGPPVNGPIIVNREVLTEIRQLDYRFCYNSCTVQKVDNDIKLQKAKDIRGNIHVQ